MAAIHRINEDNMQQTYQSEEGYYNDYNKLYIAATKNQDVMDWRRIPLGTFKDSKIYRNAEPYLKNIKT